MEKLYRTHKQVGKFRGCAKIRTPATTHWQSVLETRSFGVAELGCNLVWTSECRSVGRKMQTFYGKLGGIKEVLKMTHALLVLKQGVALTGRNTTGPPSCTAPGELRCAALECYRRRQTTEDNRRQRAKQYWPLTLYVGEPVPESVIAAETTNCFKNRLGKFWNKQEVIFKYKYA